ncbi:MAG: cache domain-containing protein [Candidatus Krumholzibacteriia bacterium]
MNASPPGRPAGLDPARSSRRPPLLRLWPRVVVPALLGVALVSAAFFAVLLPRVRENIMDRRRVELRHLAAPVFHRLEALEARARAGEITVDEAQRRAIEYVRELRYGDDGRSYFWISDLTPTLIAHPYVPELERQDLRDYADSEGRHLFREMVEVVLDDPVEHDGYVTYRWQWQDDPDLMLPKLSYVKLFPPWGWIVGTGVYIADLQRETAALMRAVTAVAAGVVVLVAVLTGWLVWLQQHSERRLRRARAGLQVSELQRQAILDHTFEMIALVDLEGRILEANRTALESIGGEMAAVREKPVWAAGWWQELPEEQERIEEAVRQGAAGEFVRFETVQRARDGLRSVDFSLNPVFDDGGSVLFLVAEGRDITERKLAEQTRQRLESRLRESQRYEAVGKLAAGVAHDFNNLLTTILGNAELAQLELAADHPARESLGPIVRAAETGAQLTRQLLSFAGRGRFQSAPVDIHRILQDLRSLLGHAAGPDTRIELQLAPGPAVIIGDAAELQSALLNLGLNALQAMPGGGLLTFATRREGAPGDGPAADRDPGAKEQVVVEVRDTGTGIAPDIQRHVFEPFFTTRAELGGTGLGLAAVHGCVQSHGGTIDVDSIEGEGTTITIRLPLHDEVEPVTERETGAEPAAGGDILLVESNAEARRTIAGLLRRGGCRVTEAADAGEALAALEVAGEVDLVLFSTGAPAGSGMTLWREVRRRRPRVPGIALSAGGEPAALAALQEAGVAAVLPKPPPPDELRRRVARHRRRRRDA